MLRYNTKEEKLWREVVNLSRLPSFADALSEPVHRWYRYPAGFSPKAVEAALEIYDLKRNDIVLDPFAGAGTTQVVCKIKGINSIGLEAHPLVYDIASTKLDWNYDAAELESLDDLIESLDSLHLVHDRHIIEKFPQLVLDCFEYNDLMELVALQQYILSSCLSNRTKKLAELALVSILRKVAIAETGWSYVLPKRRKKGIAKNATQQLKAQLQCMKKDIFALKDILVLGDTNILCDDSRYMSDMESLKDYQDRIDLTFTSPPYLNNYDYADRMRLEMYFLGLASCWSDITNKARMPLVVSCTTQVKRNDRSIADILGSGTMRAVSVITDIERICATLSNSRRRPNGKLGKNYDVVVARYFEDMVKVFQGLRVLHKKDSRVIMILGDSAPYGVYVDTSALLGRIALDTGFVSCNTVTLRTRGNKWNSNGRRHFVPLSEKLLIIGT